VPDDFKLGFQNRYTVPNGALDLFLPYRNETPTADPTTTRTPMIIPTIAPGLRPPNKNHIYKK